MFLIALRDCWLAFKYALFNASIPEVLNEPEELPPPLRVTEPDSDLRTAQSFGPIGLGNVHAPTCRQALPSPPPLPADAPLKDRALAYARLVARIAVAATHSDQFVLCECQGHDDDDDDDLDPDFRRGFFPLVSMEFGAPTVIALVCECCADVVLLNNGRLIAS